MFGERLKQIRKSKKMTQQERHYQSLEYGKIKPSFETLIALADTFEVSLDYLTGRKIIENNLSEYAFFEQETLQWINNMLLCDEIRLKDIPEKIRISSSSIYNAALRVSNGLSCKRFVQDMKILCRDIYIADDEAKQEQLVNVLAKYLQINDHRNEADFIDFEKDIYEPVLQKLQARSRTVGEIIRKGLENKGTGK